MQLGRLMKSARHDSPKCVRFAGVGLGVGDGLKCLMAVWLDLHDCDPADMQKVGVKPI